MEELAKKQQELKSNRPSSAEMRKHNLEVKRLENQLETALTKYNEIKSGNQGLRREIDVLRKQQLVQYRVNEGYKVEIKKATDTIRNLNIKTQVGARGYEETNN